MPRKKPPPNPWDAARSLLVVRGYDMYEPKELEDGVKFFVLMLEQLDCTTMFSCEGHPAGFYVMFVGPESVARDIVRCGFFEVELCREESTYRISLYGNEHSSIAVAGKAWVEASRKRCLRLVATAWVAKFGPLKATNP